MKKMLYLLLILIAIPALYVGTHLIIGFDKIAYTQPSVSIEEMIGKFVFSGGGAVKSGKLVSHDSAAAPEGDSKLE